MRLGMIGLGKMGGSMTTRLIDAGHEVVGYDLDGDRIKRLEEEGMIGARSTSELLENLPRPRALWVMVPAGAVDRAIEQLLPGLETGDVLVDGGNSFYRDSIRRFSKLAERRISFIDVGTSGGIRGLRNGYCLMIGGEPAAVERLTPIFESLAPGPDRGWGHVGPAGSGHFVKMIHNGILYGLMESYGEGFAILKESDFELDLARIAGTWRFGSVIRSWLLELAEEALTGDPDLSQVAPYVQDSGEGRWTVAEAIDRDVPAPVITLSLIRRLSSRDEEGFSDRLLAALRKGFGGHEVKKGT